MQRDLHDLGTAEAGDLLAVTMSAGHLGHVLDTYAPGRGLTHHGPAKLFQIFELVQRTYQVDRAPVPQRTAGPIDVLGA